MRLLIGFLIAAAAYAQSYCRVWNWAEQGNQTIAVLGYQSSPTTPVQASYPNATITVFTSGSQSIASATYVSGGSFTGAQGSTATVAFLGVPLSAGSGAIGTLTLTGTNTVAPGTPIAINASGSGFLNPSVSGVLSNGTATASGTIVLKSVMTGTLATIYSDSLGNPQTNPFTLTAGSTASGNGYSFFYALCGAHVDVQISGTGVPVPFTLGDIIAGGGGSSGGNSVTISCPATGGDVAPAINAAITYIQSGSGRGGVISFTGSSQTCTIGSTVVIPAGITLNVQSAQLSSTINPVVQLGGNYSALVGAPGGSAEISSSCTTGRVVFISSSIPNNAVWHPEVSNLHIDVTGSAGSCNGLEAQSWYGHYNDLYITHSGASGGLGTGNAVVLEDQDPSGNGVGAYLNNFTNLRAGDNPGGVPMGFGTGIFLHNENAAWGVTQTNFFNTYSTWNNVALKTQATTSVQVRWTSFFGGGLSYSNSDNVQLSGSDQISFHGVDNEGSATGYGINCNGSNGELYAGFGSSFGNNSLGTYAAACSDTDGFGKSWDASDHAGVDEETILFNGSLQRLKMQNLGYTTPTEIGYHWTGNIWEIGNNLKRISSTQANLIDPTQGGGILSMGLGSLCWYTATAGSNPRTLTQVWCSAPNMVASSLQSTGLTTIGTNLQFGAVGSHIQEDGANADASGKCGISGTTCTYTFNTPYTSNAPACTASDENNPAPVQVAVSTTAVTFTIGTGGASGDKIDFHCFGYPN